MVILVMKNTNCRKMLVTCTLLLASAANVHALQEASEVDEALVEAGQILEDPNGYAQGVADELTAPQPAGHSCNFNHEHGYGSCCNYEARYCDYYEYSDGAWRGTGRQTW